MVCKPKGNVQNIYGGFVLGVWCVSLKERCWTCGVYHEGLMLGMWCAMWCGNRKDWWHVH